MGISDLMGLTIEFHKILFPKIHQTITRETLTVQGVASISDFDFAFYDPSFEHSNLLFSPILSI